MKGYRKIINHYANDLTISKIVTIGNTIFDMQNYSSFKNKKIVVCHITLRQVDQDFYNIEILTPSKVQTIRLFPNTHNIQESDSMKTYSKDISLLIVSQLLNVNISMLQSLI